MISYESKLLATARRMPEAAQLLDFIENTMLPLWRAATGLELDTDKFTSGVLRAWERHAVKGVTLQAIPMAAVIEHAAGLALTPGQRQTLRNDAERVNHELLTAVARAEGREGR